MHRMDTVFSLPESARANFLQSIMQSSGCSYICLWSYDSLLSNRLLCLDGLFNVRINQASTSLGSVAQRLFDQYRSLVFDVNDNDRIPGLAFKNRSYLELQQPDLLRLAWTQIQAQFYQEARIKTAVFMGCNNGEMELGFPNMSQDDIQTALRNWFPDEFSRLQSSSNPQPNIDQSQNPPSSSSSSLRSLSLSAGSPEYSSLLFNIPGSSPHFPQDQSLTASSSSSHQQVFQALAQSTAQSSTFPTPEGENDAMMRAILHVLSTNNPPPSTPTSLLHQPHHRQNLPDYMVRPDQTSAFKRYSPIIPRPSSQMGPDQLRQSLFKRSLTFFRGLNFMRMRESVQTTTRPSSTQLHHMISERRRREKLNENFQALRSLLPPGTKKDKASILTTAKEALTSLMAEIEKLRERNKQLEVAATSSSSSSMAARPVAKEASDDHEIFNERLNVRISHELSESSSSEQERIADLEVTVRGQSSQVDILIRLLEFLKQDQNLSLISMEANTYLAHANSFNRITIRLRVEGSEWDESAFQEAVRRVVADLAQ
ncbi:putative transcription factor bHLH041 [Prosopis cineraria]|uniref:putative transcription factor bHLH041 n=1 Tax=Prosopis cineraria TaxID=364024 RepID=UPI00241074BF|nr:putative transcription factor bHLH041 [Prosopis cineraria]